MHLKQYANRVKKRLTGYIIVTIYNATQNDIVYVDNY